MLWADEKQAQRLSARKKNEKEEDVLKESMMGDLHKAKEDKPCLPKTGKKKTLERRMRRKHSFDRHRQV